MKLPWLTFGLLTLMTSHPASTHAQEEEWAVHDMNRPLPPVVEPKSEEELAESAKAPEDAVILFDGTDLSQWQKPNGEPAGWRIVDGAMEVVPDSGSIQTKRGFGSCKLHIEWKTPENVEGEGQDRGNSGVFLMNQYEIQVLDTLENRTYADGMAGAVYGQNPPLANALRPAGQWQYYDIEFHAPKFGDNGEVLEKARFSVKLNGIPVQENFELDGATVHGKRASYKPHPDKLPIGLQDHGSPVQFRNIWVQPLAD